MFLEFALLYPLTGREDLTVFLEDEEFSVVGRESYRRKRNQVGLSIEFEVQERAVSKQDQTKGLVTLAVYHKHRDRWGVYGL